MGRVAQHFGEEMLPAHKTAPWRFSCPLLDVWSALLLQPWVQESPGHYDRSIQ